MKKFEIPELIIVSFNNNDIITDSEPGDYWNHNGPIPLGEEEEDFQFYYAY